jgi:hypothetical protein
MKILFLAYFFILALAVCFVSTCSAPPSPVLPEPDSLALQHRLSHSLDSVDSLYPPGCTWDGQQHICPDLKPPRAP